MSWSVAMLRPSGKRPPRWAIDQFSLYSLPMAAVAQPRLAAAPLPAQTKTCAPSSRKAVYPSGVSRAWFLRRSIAGIAANGSAMCTTRIPIGIRARATCCALASGHDDVSSRTLYAVQLLNPINDQFVKPFSSMVCTSAKYPAHPSTDPGGAPPPTGPALRQRHEPSLAAH